MFTKAEAEIFVKELLEDMFPNGKVDLVGKFYSEDIVGHTRNQTIGFEDIKNRVIAIKNTTEKTHFAVQQVEVFDNFIAISCKQNWTTKSDGAFHDSLVFAVYRIENKKIVELWGFFDGGAILAPYQEVNKHFEHATRHLEINKKTKETFLNRLITLPPSQASEAKELSKVEKECLYYYLHGVSAKEAALTLNLSPRTVETYLAEIKEKLQCHTKHDLRKKFFPE
jgi:DNA-binding CsgD family transcriptional regulator